MSDKIICTFSTPGQLCGKMLVNVNGVKKHYCSLPSGECPHQGYEQTLIQPEPDNSEIFTEVIEFAIETDSSKEFLQCWLEGDWESIKNEWPEFKGYVDDE